MKFYRYIKTTGCFTFDNYVQAFEELDFIRTFFNSVLITVLGVAVIVLFSSMAAYALNRRKGKISGLIFFLFIAAMLIPFQSVMIPLVSLFGKFDLLNRFGIIFMYLGFGSSLSIFLYHGSFKEFQNLWMKPLRLTAQTDGKYSGTSFSDVKANFSHCSHFKYYLDLE